MNNFYDELGGELAIRKLVYRFYELIEVDPKVRTDLMAV